MVDVVNLGIVQRHAKEGDDAVIPSMVQSGKDGANDEEDNGRGGVQFHTQCPTIQKARKDVVILSKEEFHGMNIDGVDGGSAKVQKYTTTKVKKMAKRMRKIN